MMTDLLKLAMGTPGPQGPSILYRRQEAGFGLKAPAVLQHGQFQIKDRTHLAITIHKHTFNPLHSAYFLVIEI